MGEHGRRQDLACGHDPARWTRCRPAGAVIAGDSRVVAADPATGEVVRLRAAPPLKLASGGRHAARRRHLGLRVRRVGRAGASSARAAWSRSAATADAPGCRTRSPSPSRRVDGHPPTGRPVVATADGRTVYAVGRAGADLRIHRSDGRGSHLGAHRRADPDRGLGTDRRGRRAGRHAGAWPCACRRQDVTAAVPQHRRRRDGREDRRPDRAPARGPVPGGLCRAVRAPPGVGSGCGRTAPSGRR